MLELDTVVIPALLFAAAFSVRAGIIAFFHFGGLYGQDAYAYLDYAGELATSVIQWHLPPQAFWPAGYPALVALFASFIGHLPSAALLVSLLTGACLPPLVYLLTRELWLQLQGPQLAHPGEAAAAGLAAAAVLVLSGQAVQSSIVIMADMPALFWASLSALMLAVYHRESRPIWLVLSFGALTAATITRWIFGALWPIWLLALLVDQPRKAEYPSSLARLVGPLTGAFGLALCLALPQIVLSVGNPGPVLGHSWLVGWNPANALQNGFDTTDGRLTYPLPVALFAAEPAYHPAYLFPLLTPLFLAGAWSAALHWRHAVLPGLVTLGWIGTQYLFLAGIPYENFRFGLGFLTPVAVLTGLGLAGLWTRPDRRVGLAAAALLFSGLAGQALWTFRPSIAIIDLWEEEQHIAETVNAQLPAGSTLISFGLTESLIHDTRLRVLDLYSSPPADLLPPPGTQTFLLVDVTNVESQWKGLAPDLHLVTLRENADLVFRASLGKYTLYYIVPR